MVLLWMTAAVVAGFIIDLIAGDPRWLYHPVRIIGNGISLAEKLLRKIFPKTKTGERAAGIVLVILVTGISAAVPLVALQTCATDRISCGDVLVLSASGNKVFEKRK